MGIFKLILLVAVLMIAYQLAKIILRRIQLHKNAHSDVKPVANVVRCIICGVHVPVKAARLNQSGDYHCRDHDNST